jgi:hypothetical protein
MSNASFSILNATSVRIYRTVYPKWNGLHIDFTDRDNEALLTIAVGNDEFQDDHKPLPVTWEAPHFHIPTSEAHELLTPVELFNIKETNRPEDPHLTAIRELLLSYDEGNETAEDMLRAISEVIFGREEGLQEDSQAVPSTGVEEDEVPY